jgi:hypothetical protein
MKRFLSAYSLDELSQVFEVIENEGRRILAGVPRKLKRVELVGGEARTVLEYLVITSPGNSEIDPSQNGWFFQHASGCVECNVALRMQSLVQFRPVEQPQARWRSTMAGLHLARPT